MSVCLMAQASSSSNSSGSGELRRGKWTVEEERFVERVSGRMLVLYMQFETFHF